MIESLERVCVKLPGSLDPELSDQVFVPIFHEWIRNRSLDLVLIDVADYAHVPESPGVMLVAHDTSFALDRSDGSFGLLVQRRRPTGIGAAAALRAALRDALVVAARLDGEPQLAGRVSFDGRHPRVEANDRLLAPNTDAGFRAFEPLVRSAVAEVYPDSPAVLTRVANDPRDRLAVDVSVAIADSPVDGD